MNLVVGTAGPRSHQRRDGDDPGLSHPESAYPARDLRMNSLVVQIGPLYYQGGQSVDIRARQGGEVRLLANDGFPEDNRAVTIDGVKGWNVTLSR